LNAEWFLIYQRELAVPLIFPAAKIDFAPGTLVIFGRAENCQEFLLNSSTADFRAFSESSEMELIDQNLPQSVLEYGGLGAVFSVSISAK
jgi:hypothetical protein